MQDGIIKSIDYFLGDVFNLALPDPRPVDVVEIFIIAFFTYWILKFIFNTRAWVLLKGIVVIAALFLAAAVFQMKTILWIGERFVSVAFVGLVVVFQPELRNALEHLGTNNLFSRILPNVLRRSGEDRFSKKTLNDLVSSCLDMGEVKTGALIVIEKDVALGEYIRTGINIDAVVTRQLILNIFEKNTPLHDGAIVISGDRIVAATCYLPLSTNTTIGKELGTRHRAALGVSEVSDSVTIVVSEETGGISVAEGGKLTRHLDGDGLREILLALQKAGKKKGEEDNAEN